jgi:hypothetical protein
LISGFVGSAPLGGVPPELRAKAKIKGAVNRAFTVSKIED